MTGYLAHQGQGSRSRAELLNRGQPGSTAEQLQEETRREFCSVPPPPITYFLQAGHTFHSSITSQSSIQFLNPLMNYVIWKRPHRYTQRFTAPPPPPRVLLRSSSPSSLTISGLEPPRRQQWPRGLPGSLYPMFSHFTDGKTN